MDWKTTVSGIVIGVASILKVFGVDIPDTILNTVIGIGAIALGFFAKDKPKA